MWVGSGKQGKGEGRWVVGSWDLKYTGTEDARRRSEGGAGGLGGKDTVIMQMNVLRIQVPLRGCRSFGPHSGKGGRSFKKEKEQNNVRVCRRVFGSSPITYI